MLDHLAESGIYTEADLQPFSNRLGELRAIIRKDGEQGKHPPQLTKLMMKKLEGCEKVLKTLEGTLNILSVELVSIHQRLVSVRRQIAAAAAKPKPARTEIKMLQDELRKIDSKRVDGKFLGPGGSSVPAGQAILVGILEDCFEIVHDINVRNDEVPMTLQPIYDRLSEIRSQLEHLVLTHRWTLRETDLWNYQVSLKEIDRLRVDGKFVDSEGKQPEGQLVLLYLLRRCYGLIYRLVASSEPISEELMPISNKLSTVSKCLKEVSKYGGPFTMRDLYPYRLALHQIDNMRTAVKDQDGKETGVRKWLGRDGSIPEGQAILRAQYEEVEQTITEMLNREEDEDDEDGYAEEEEDWDGSAADEEESDLEESSGIGSGSGASLVSPGLADVSFPASPVNEHSLDASALGSTHALNLTSAAAPLSLSAALESAIHTETQRTPRASHFPCSASEAPPMASASGLSPPPSTKNGASLPIGVAPLANTTETLALPPPGDVAVIPGLTARPGQAAAQGSSNPITIFSDPHQSNVAGVAHSSVSSTSPPSSISATFTSPQPTSSIEALTANMSDSLRVE